MGVPAFFRWLSRKYPSVIVNCIEEKTDQLDGTTIPVDSSKPNPNGVEFDNLYLDMNGIIHPCTHPEDKPAPKNEDEMMIAIFDCIDRLFRIVRPRKLLYMAIDGVAPRAKMNQQRSRRFRASKEVVEKVDEIARIRAEMITKGYVVPPEKEKGSHFDSNCITPGTPFMARLSSCLHYYIHDRLNKDPGWRNIKVVLSDANVPGEGEHKIMDYIRKQRAQPDHDPNTQHCLCGADADLIMLGLATHEPNFTIIREEFKPNQPRPCEICGQHGHEMKACTGIATTDTLDSSPDFSAETQFIFVRLCVLREYLERELTMPGIPFKYDFERALDDWVFMCFFVGNDFLPHLPSLEIREGAIDRLINLYKNAVEKTGGFVTDSGDVNLDRVQLIMAELGKVEDGIFKKRQETEQMFKQRNKMRKRSEKQRTRPAFLPQGQFAPTPIGQGGQPLQNVRQEAYYQRVQNMHQNSHGGGRNSDQNNRGQKRPIEDDSSEEEEEVNDEVRLWEDGFKERYYESKFDIASDNLQFRHSIALQYVRGLCWVLRYYYQGCASWDWYFPYHYAPFASDFQNIGGLSTAFDRGTQPFKPLEQLMSVFPAASSSHVPSPWATLMSDPDSPIIDFYPEDFKIDLNGKKFAWQGVALLPFVDEKRLHKALEPYYLQLTDAERKRNVRGDDRLYIGRDHASYSFFVELYNNPNNLSVESELSAEGMRGSIVLAEDCVKQGGSLPSPVDGLEVIRNNTVLCVRFRDPKYGESFIFAAKRLNGALEPPKVLKPEDLKKAQKQSWYPQIGMTRGNQRGYLGNAGHRMLGHAVRNREPGVYSAVPPLMYSYDNAGNRGAGNRGRVGGNRSSGGGSDRIDRDGGQSYRYQPYQPLGGGAFMGGPRPPGYNTNSLSHSSYSQGRNYNSSAQRGGNTSSSQRGGYNSSQGGGYNSSSHRGGYSSSSQRDDNRSGNQRRDTYPKPSSNQGGGGYWQGGNSRR